MWILWQIGIFISIMFVSSFRVYVLTTFITILWVIETFIMLDFFSPLQFIQLFVILVSWIYAQSSTAKFMAERILINAIVMSYENGGKAELRHNIVPQALPMVFDILDGQYTKYSDGVGVFGTLRHPREDILLDVNMTEHSGVLHITATTKESLQNKLDNFRVKMIEKTLNNNRLKDKWGEISTLSVGLGITEEETKRLLTKAKLKGCEKDDGE